MPSGAYLQQLIPQLFAQLTRGCGNSSCTNEHCASSVSYLHSGITATQAAALSIRLTQQNPIICSRHDRNVAESDQNTDTQNRISFVSSLCPDISSFDSENAIHHEPMDVGNDSCSESNSLSGLIAGGSSSHIPLSRMPVEDAYSFPDSEVEEIDKPVTLRFYHPMSSNSSVNATPPPERPSISLHVAEHESTDEEDACSVSESKCESQSIGITTIAPSDGASSTGDSFGGIAVSSRTPRASSIANCPISENIVLPQPIIPEPSRSRPSGAGFISPAAFSRALRSAIVASTS
ncbi:unnamed protein product, partial [Protopolystoma xenopodis]